MKNIYIVNEYLSSTKNGIGTYLNELLYCLQVIEAKVCLLTFNSDYKEFTIKSSDKLTEMNFPYFPNSDFGQYPGVIKRFLQLHITDSIDNVFCFNYSLSDKLMQMVRYTFPLSKQVYVIHDFSWTGLLLGNTRKLKQIMSERKDAETDKQMTFIIDTWQREQQMMDIADKVVCLSKGTYRVVKDICLIDKQKIALIPNALRDRKGNKVISQETKEHWKKQLFIEKDKKILLFVGRTSKEKGFNALLDAIKIAIKSFPNLRLVVAGNPSSSCFSQDIASLITYTGHVNKQSLTKWYQISDIGIIPSYSEQCSYVGIEMMMYGLSIVASNGYGVHDMFHEGKNAIIAPIGKSPKIYSNRLAKAIIRLLGSQELSDQLKKGARQAYEQEYHIKYMRQKYKELFTTL